MIQLIEPYTEENVRALKMGDMVHVTGVVYTGRDASTNTCTRAASRPWPSKTR